MDKTPRKLPPLSPEATFNKLAALCAASEHCKHDLAVKMEGWGLMPEQMQEVINKLEKERYVDDLRYAKAYARDKVRFARWGKRKIRMQLTIKQISSDIINEALNGIPYEEYEEALNGVIESKRRQVKGRNDYERDMKILRHACSKGFEPHLVMEQLKTEGLAEEDDD